LINKNPRNYRTRRDIWAHILEKLREHRDHGIGITAINYGVGLQHNQGKEYMDLLKNRNLVKIQSERPIRYMITDRGLKWLEAFEVLEQVFWVDKQ